MSRIKLPEPSELSEAQRRVYDAAAAARRGRAPLPLLAWLASPEFADRAQSLGEFVRYQTTLSPRLSELAILVVARFWTSHYEWFAHKTEALKAGLDEAVIADIAARTQPHFTNRDEQVIYDFCTHLNETHSVPDDLYREAAETIGEKGVVELVGILGYYTLISMTLNTFEINAPAGYERELRP
jgi:4-carboxymuconolactone decarboxylase